MVGRLSESLATAVKRTMADLLVLGFRTHAFRRSSSEGLVKGLQIPVLAVRGERAKSAGIGSLELKKLLCATDFSESSEKALKTAKMLADSFSAKLTVLHVLPSQALEARVDRKNDVDISRQERLTRAKDGLGNFLKNSGVEDSGVIEEGDPRRVISSFSLEYRADLIVVGARGLASLKGLLPIGRVADMVLKSAPCPVLVVH